MGVMSVDRTEEAVSCFSDLVLHLTCLLGFGCFVPKQDAPASKPSANGAEGESEEESEEDERWVGREMIVRAVLGFKSLSGLLYSPVYLH